MEGTTTSGGGGGGALDNHRARQSLEAREAEEREAVRRRVKANLEAKHLHHFAKSGDLAAVITGVTGVRWGRPLIPTPSPFPFPFPRVFALA